MWLNLVTALAAGVVSFFLKKRAEWHSLKMVRQLQLKKFRKHVEFSFTKYPFVALPFSSHTIDTQANTTYQLPAPHTPRPTPHPLSQITIDIQEPTPGRCTAYSPLSQTTRHTYDTRPIPAPPPPLTDHTTHGLSLTHLTDQSTTRRGRGD